MAWRNLGSIFSHFRSLFQFQQGQSDQRVRYTIKSHGAALAKSHKHDWLILLLLVVIEVVMYIIHPFYRFVGKDMMTDLKYPMKENTVPFWAVPVKTLSLLHIKVIFSKLVLYIVSGIDFSMDDQIYAILVPIAIFVLVYARRKDVYDLHHSILGLLFAVLVTAVFTDAMKNGAGRPRPDFFWRCFPDGIDNYDKWGDVVCHGKASDIKEGHKSFPSGHASASFAGLGFLSFYLCGKIKAFDRKGHIAKLCIIALPLLVASLVAVSRVSDYWHHWQDVFAGGLLGLIVAAFCYRQFFPSPYQDEGWGPYAYFKALEETRSNSSSASTTNAPSVQVMEAQNVSQLVPGQNVVAFGANNYTSLKMDEMESGRS